MWPLIGCLACLLTCIVILLQVKSYHESVVAKGQAIADACHTVLKVAENNERASKEINKVAGDLITAIWRPES